MIGGFWKFSSKMELTFHRPHIITDQARKGLDDLVQAGFLTVDRLNHISDALVWTPTQKMADEKPKVSMKFIEENTFPITTE